MRCVQRRCLDPKVFMTSGHWTIKSKLGRHENFMIRTNFVWFKHVQPRRQPIQFSRIMCINSHVVQIGFTVSLAFHMSSAKATIEQWSPNHTSMWIANTWIAPICYFLFGFEHYPSFRDDVQSRWKVTLLATWKSGMGTNDFENMIWQSKCRKNHGKCTGASNVAPVKALQQRWNFRT